MASRPDGLVLQGNRLTVVRNFKKQIATLRLSDDGRKAKLIRQVASSPNRVLTTAKEFRGYQAIHEAVWLGEDTATYATTVRALAAGGVELDKVSPSAGRTPLQMAQRRGYDGLERILRTVTTADRPADADAALLAADRKGDPDAVAQVLVAMAADPDALDDRHDTPGW